MASVATITVDDFQRSIAHRANAPWQDASDSFLDFYPQDFTNEAVAAVNAGHPELAFLRTAGPIATRDELAARCNNVINSTLLLPLCQHMQFSDEIRSFAQKVCREYGVLRITGFPFRARYFIKFISKSILAAMTPAIFHFRSAIFITPAPDIEMLFGAIRTLAPANALEIGTYWGTTTLGLATNSPKTAMYTVDICREMMCQTARYQEGEVLSRDQVGSMFGNARLSIAQIFADSKKIETYRDRLPRSIDFVFFDGDHSYDAVLQDAENIVPLLAPGAMLFWHDYKKDGNVEVVPALDDLATRHRELAIRHIEGTWLAWACV